MKTGTTFNEYGTMVSSHICDTCGNRFTVCPPVKNKDWEDCLGVDCKSYDAKRDADKLFESGDPSIKRTKIVRIEA